jgi:hypothetical protein
VKVKVGITIDAPPAAVWQVIEPIERHVDWMVDAATITFTSPQTRGIGTTFDCLTRFGPLRLNDKMAVTEWAPERVMGIEHGGLVTGRGRFTLRRRGGNRTRFTWTERLDWPWYFGGAVTGLVARPVLKSVWRRNLRRLKAIVEGQQ